VRIQAPESSVHFCENAAVFVVARPFASAQTEVNDQKIERVLSLVEENLVSQR
jgi:hypothetical protein